MMGKRSRIHVGEGCPPCATAADPDVREERNILV